jgi:hypothetical protein
MPEAAMDENHGSPIEQNNVGPSREILAMESKPIAETMHESSDREFGSRIACPDAAHVLAAPSLRQDVGHGRA